MSADHPSSSDRARSARAARWFIRVEQNTLSPRERKHFKHWLSDPLNLAAFQAIAHKWIAADPRALRAAIRQEHPGLLSAGPSSGKARRRSRRLIVLVAAASVLIAILLMQVGRESAHTATIIVTHASEHRDVTLDDGSLLEIEPETTLAVDFRPTQRVVHLTKGEARFDVARDRQRPFIVVGETLQAEAIGTRFLVRVREDRTWVVVYEGVVEVKPRGSSAHAVVTLRAGERLSIPADLIEDGRASVPSRVRPGERLEFSHATVGEIVEQFNRRHAIPVTGSPDIGNRPIDLMVMSSDSSRSLGDSKTSGTLAWSVTPTMNGSSHHSRVWTMSEHA